MYVHEMNLFLYRFLVNVFLILIGIYISYIIIYLSPKKHNIKHVIKEKSEITKNDHNKNKNNLSVRQQEAQKHVETFNFMFEEMSRLQTENTELRLENYKLKEEIQKLTESQEQEKSVCSMFILYTTY